MRHVTIRFANILAAVLLVTATTTALVIDRQAANVQLYNTTVTCGQAFFGGCCTGTLDMYGNNPSCYNATLAAYNVGGSTMGVQSEYACLNRKTSDKTNALYSALCCKFMQLYVNPITSSKFMSCGPPTDAE